MTTKYALSAMTAIMLGGGALGFAFFALTLLDRLAEAESRRKARARRYRQSRQAHPAGRLKGRF